MRKFFTLFTLTLAIGAGLFYSCQKEEIGDEAISASLKKAQVNTDAVTANFVYDDHACLGVPHEFVIEAAEDENMQIQAEFTDGEWTQIAQISKSDEASTTFVYTFSAELIEKENPIQLRYKSGNGGFTKGYYITIDDCGCEESFAYETEDNLSVVFAYTSDVDLENAEVKITCPHIFPTDGFIAEDGKVYEVNNTGNHTVLTWTGDIAACQEITFDLTFIPDCSKKNNGNGAVTIWTDFKVNEASKKTITPPDNAECETVLVDETETTVCSWPIIKYYGCE
ncbi:hypothetical protein [Mangrovibacterium lignilyticum]|uniref:hypothetical protein n=1 Tax=Mangrovibacterium lignilyticum TaxID=2668052 RepID=UPI0013D0066A|nr:hypothetical protein [Mangrovibacterium lignilyticum]